jgi:EAL domain-containing protein (putative c-di-GMP-specific phosphodiesterase class I)
MIKLDLKLVRDRPSVKMATILNAVGAQVERTGAQVLAEGIETEDQIDVAHSLGATLAQGYLFGRPAPLPVRPPAREQALPMLGRAAAPRVADSVRGAAGVGRGRDRPALRGLAGGP